MAGIPDPVETLRDLVRFDTTNPPGNELPALEYLQGLLEKRGIEAVLQRSAQGRGNLLALIPAPAGEKGPPLVLLSHIDVVAADAGQWTHPPFAAALDGGYLYGRGTVDTKQLTVMELAAVCALRETGIAPSRDVYLLVASDEESGSRYGLRFFLENQVRIGGREATGRRLLAGSDVISEGGGFPVVAGGRQFYLCETGQKGCGAVEFRIRAREGVGPFLPGADGMRRAMALVRKIGAMRHEETLLPTARRFVERLREACGSGEGWRDKLSEPMRGILRAIGRNTLTVTMVGGRSVSEVTVTCDVRLLPGAGREYLDHITAGLCQRFDCECQVLSLGEGYESDCGGELPGLLEEATRRALGPGSGDTELLPFLSMGSSDGSWLAPLGARVYGYSPVLARDMTFDTAVGMVHGVDERIHVDSVRFGAEVLTDAVLGAVGCRR